jgi:hypothetical protein
MDTNTQISNAARRIARQSRDGRRGYFDAEGTMIVEIIGPDAFGPAQFSAATASKVTERRAQDLLDADRMAEEEFPGVIHEAAIGMYLTDLDNDRSLQASREGRGF